MEKAETINRVWLIIAIYCPLTFYLYYYGYGLFEWVGLIGSLALFDTQRKANWYGWDHGIVLLAHFIALVSLCLSVIILLFLYAVALPKINFNYGWPIIFFIAVGCTAYAHNKVRENYDNVRKQLEEKTSDKK